MESDRTRIIGERIRSTRERHHLTCEDVAERAGGRFTAARLANFEDGIRRPGIEDVEAIADVLGDVSASWLLALDERSPAGTRATASPAA
jgi:transcriptional regulator with XRE-family HTH domain